MAKPLRDGEVYYADEQRWDEEKKSPEPISLPTRAPRLTREPWLRVLLVSDVVLSIIILELSLQFLGVSVLVADALITASFGLGLGLFTLRYYGKISIYRRESPTRSGRMPRPSGKLAVGLVLWMILNLVWCAAHLVSWLHYAH